MPKAVRVHPMVIPEVSTFSITPEVSADIGDDRLLQLFTRYDTSIDPRVRHTYLRVLTKTGNAADGAPIFVEGPVHEVVPNQHGISDRAFLTTLDGTTCVLAYTETNSSTGSAIRGRMVARVVLVAPDDTITFGTATTIRDNLLPFVSLSSYAQYFIPYIQLRRMSTTRMAVVYQYSRHNGATNENIRSHHVAVLDVAGTAVSLHSDTQLSTRTWSNASSFVTTDPTGTFYLPGEDFYVWDALPLGPNQFGVLLERQDDVRREKQGTSSWRYRIRSSIWVVSYALGASSATPGNRVQVTESFEWTGREYTSDEYLLGVTGVEQRTWDEGDLITQPGRAVRGFIELTWTRLSVVPDAQTWVDVLRALVVVSTAANAITATNLPVRSGPTDLIDWQNTGYIGAWKWLSTDVLAGVFWKPEGFYSQDYATYDGDYSRLESFTLNVATGAVVLEGQLATWWSVPDAEPYLTQTWPHSWNGDDREEYLWVQTPGGWFADGTLWFYYGEAYAWTPEDGVYFSEYGFATVGPYNLGGIIPPFLAYYDLDVKLVYPSYHGESTLRVLINEEVKHELIGGGSKLDWTRFPLGVLDPATDIINISLQAATGSPSVTVEARLCLVERSPMSTTPELPELGLVYVIAGTSVHALSDVDGSTVWVAESGFGNGLASVAALPGVGVAFGDLVGNVGRFDLLGQSYQEVSEDVPGVGYVYGLAADAAGRLFVGDQTGADPSGVNYGAFVRRFSAPYTTPDWTNADHDLAEGPWVADIGDVAPDAAGGLYVAGGAAEQVAHIAPDGSTAWVSPLSGNDAWSVVRGVDGAVYVGQSVGYLERFTPAGVSEWFFNIPNAGTLGGLAVAPDGALYATSVRITRLSVDATGASVEWQTESLGSAGRVATDTAGNVYSQHGATVVSYAPDGSERWSVALTSQGDGIAHSSGRRAS